MENSSISATLFASVNTPISWAVVYDQKLISRPRSHECTTGGIVLGGSGEADSNHVTGGFSSAVRSAVSVPLRMNPVTEPWQSIGSVPVGFWQTTIAYGPVPVVTFGVCV